ncbi:MAG: glycosyltransferase family 2 protein, partial [Kiritimatiellia bacterium]
CLRLRRAGYKIFYTPFAKLYHHESKTRRAQEENHEKYTMFTKYAGPSLMIDPHYHTMVSPCK